MRRKEQEITDRQEIDQVIKNSIVMRVGLADKDQPYIVPVCFGYDGIALYFHGVKKGMKVDILKQNPKICFEFEEGCSVIKSDDSACDFSMQYKSVIGFGKSVFIDDEDEKRKILNIIKSQYSDKEFELPENMVKGTCVVKIEIESIFGKHGD